MDLTEVLEKGIIAHITVKMELLSYINGGDYSKGKQIASDKECLIGQWIYGPGQAYSQLEEFQELKRIHANFHSEAFNAFCLKKEGKTDEAAAYINTGPFENMSKAMQKAIIRMKYKAKSTDELEE